MTGWRGAGVRRQLSRGVERSLRPFVHGEIDGRDSSAVCGGFCELASNHLPSNRGKYREGFQYLPVNWGTTAALNPVGSWRCGFSGKKTGDYQGNLITCRSISCPGNCKQLALASAQRHFRPRCDTANRNSADEVVYDRDRNHGARPPSTFPSRAAALSFMSSSSL